MQRYWFRAVGPLWLVPTSWQGFALVGGYVAAIAGASLVSPGLAMGTAVLGVTLVVYVANRFANTDPWWRRRRSP